MDELGLEAVVNFAPQPPNQHFEHVGERVMVLIPDMRCNRTPRDDASGVLDQILQEGEFLGRERDCDTPTRHMARRDIHAEIGDLVLFGNDSWVAPGKSLDSRSEFHEREWLGQVVVRARFQSANTVFDCVPSGKHQNRGRDPLLPNYPAEVEPGPSGQEYVQDDHVEAAEHRSFATLGEITCGAGLDMLIAEAVGDNGGQFGIVFYKEDTHVGLGLGTRVCYRRGRGCFPIYYTARAVSDTRSGAGTTRYSLPKNDYDKR